MELYFKKGEIINNPGYENTNSTQTPINFPFATLREKEIIYNFDAQSSRKLIINFATTKTKNKHHKTQKYFAKLNLITQNQI